MNKAIKFIKQIIGIKFNSSKYWENRYRNGGNSGAGSYRNLAIFKSQVINNFVKVHKVKSVLEFGSGDGSQLMLADYPEYIGIDVSEKAVQICKERFKNDTRKKFLSLEQYKGETAELVLSLDVIFHLVEDDIYHDYMLRLFDSSKRNVIIYSSNKDEMGAPHVRHRKFTEWISAHKPRFSLIDHIPQKYPFDNNDEYTSFCDFYIYGIDQ